MQSPQLCVKLWRFFMQHKFTPYFPQLFPVYPVEKPVDNVDNLRYVNSNKRLQNKLCKLIIFIFTSYLIDKVFK